MLVLYLYRRTVCTVLYPLCNDSASSCSYSYCGCTIAQCVPCLYLLYSGLAWLARVMYLLPVCVLVPCLCYCAVSTGNVRVTRFVLVPCCGCTLAQCVPCLYLLYSGLAWPARVMYVLSVFVLVPCVYYCTVSTGNVRFTRFVLVPCCGCTIAPCVQCVYLLYSGLAWPARVMYLLPVFVLVPCVYYCTVPARAAYLLVEFVLVLWLYHCTVCTVLVL